VVLSGGWTIRWRRFHARRPVTAEVIRVVAWIGYAVVMGLMIGSVSLIAVAIAVIAARTWWDYRPNGRGTRLLAAKRANPRRGFGWAEDRG
jgi:hypothetical protein